MFTKEDLSWVLGSELWKCHYKAEPINEVNLKFLRIVKKFLVGVPDDFEKERVQDLDRWLAEVLPDLIKEAGVADDPLPMYLPPLDGY